MSKYSNVLYYLKNICILILPLLFSGCLTGFDNTNALMVRGVESTIDNTRRYQPLLVERRLVNERAFDLRINDIRTGSQTTASDLISGEGLHATCLVEPVVIRRSFTGGRFDAHLRLVSPFAYGADALETESERVSAWRRACDCETPDAEAAGMCFARRAAVSVNRAAGSIEELDGSLTRETAVRVMRLAGRPLADFQTLLGSERGFTRHSGGTPAYLGMALRPGDDLCFHGAHYAGSYSLRLAEFDDLDDAFFSTAEPGAAACHPWRTIIGLGHGEGLVDEDNQGRDVLPSVGVDPLSRLFNPIESQWERVAGNVSELKDRLIGEVDAMTQRGDAPYRHAMLFVRNTDSLLPLSPLTDTVPSAGEFVAIKAAEDDVKIEGAGGNALRVIARTAVFNANGDKVRDGDTVVEVLHLPRPHDLKDGDTVTVSVNAEAGTAGRGGGDNRDVGVLAVSDVYRNSFLILVRDARLAAYVRDTISDEDASCTDQNRDKWTFHDHEYMNSLMACLVTTWAKSVGLTVEADQRKEWLLDIVVPANVRPFIRFDVWVDGRPTPVRAGTTLLDILDRRLAVSDQVHALREQLADLTAEPANDNLERAILSAVAERVRYRRRSGLGFQPLDLASAMRLEDLMVPLSTGDEITWLP